MLDKSKLHEWIDSYRQAARAIWPVCRAVMDQFEAQVNQYGYSLKHLYPTRITPLLQPYSIFD